MMSNVKIKAFLENSKTNLFISILIILSLALLLIHKVGDFDVKTDKTFNFIDQIFLVIFSIEFLIKLAFLRKKYFVTELGWVDLIAALPVFYPLFYYIMLRVNAEMLINQDTVSITIILRGFKFIRFLRIIRATRLLKFFNYVQASDNSNRRKFPFTVPLLFSMVLFVSGYFLISAIETKLKVNKVERMNKVLENLTEENLKEYLDINLDVLIIQKGFNLERRISDKEIKRIYQSFEHSRVKSKNGFILYSTKDIWEISQKIEIAIILVVLLYMFSTFVQFIVELGMIRKRRAVPPGS